MHRMPTFAAYWSDGWGAMFRREDAQKAQIRASIENDEQWQNTAAAFGYGGAFSPATIQIGGQSPRWFQRTYTKDDTP